MSNIEKYNNIIERYRNGEFGAESLSMNEILIKANERDLLQNMTVYELQELYKSSTNVFRHMFGLLIEQKLKEAE